MDAFVPSPEFLERVRHAAAVPPAPEPFVLGLRARLGERSAALRPRRRLRARTAWGLALGAVLVAAAVLALGPQNIVAALQKILGYVPGIGFVQPGSIRVLSEPVTVTRDSVTLTLEQIVADSDRTTVVYSVEGLSLAAANSDGEGGPVCIQAEMLRLPGGRELAADSGGGPGWGSGYRSWLVFPAVPPDVYEGELNIPCLRDMPPGKAPENWNVPFRLKPAPPDLTVLPVINLPTPTVGFRTRAATPEAAEPETYGIVLSLDTIIPLDDGYVLLGGLHGSDGRFSLADYPTGLVVTDAEGARIPAEWDSGDYAPAQTADSRSVPFAYRIQGKSFRGPLTLTFPYVGAYLRDPVALQFDTGPNPSEGQRWELNRSFEILGIPATLRSAEMIVQEDMQGFEFAVEAPPALRSVDITLEESPGLVQTRERCCSGGGGSEPNRTGAFAVHALSDFSVAGGIIHLSIRRVELAGTWSAAWDPPVVEGQPTATAVPQACLTGEAWGAALAGPAAPIPAGLGGRILTWRDANPPEPSLFLSAADGGGERGLAFGDGSLSPDGKTLVFEQDGRMYLLDVDSGALTAITPPGVAGSRPRWSPDGARIAMNQFLENDHIVVMDADGSNLRRVTRGSSIEFLAGWSPDGEQLLYAVLGDGGKYSLKYVNINTGETSDLFSINWKNPSPALSPDGQWVAFLERPFGSLAAEVHIARLDGSDRRLMTRLDAAPFYVYNPFWSPDGKWLAVSIQDAAAFRPGDPAVALIRPDTCEAVRLNGIRGQIRSWV
jgi:hypothetical protein